MTIEKTHYQKEKERRWRMVERKLRSLRGKYPDAAVTVLIERVASDMGFTRKGVTGIAKKLGIYEELKQRAV